MWNPEIVVTTMTRNLLGDWMTVKWDEVSIRCRSAMSTETVGDIAFVNYLYLHTLYINYCAPQHVKSPLWPMEKLGIER